MRTLVLFGMVTLPLAGAEPDYVLDSIMYRSPSVPMAKLVYAFPDGLLERWLPALQRPEADSKIQAALAIAKAHRLGMKDTSRAIPPLLAELERADVPTVVRIPIVQALIDLDAKAAAPLFFKLMTDDDEQLRNLVEPVLAKWDHQPARGVWLQRLENSKHYTLARAIQLLAQVREDQAVPALQKIVRASDTSPAIRTAAAHALGQLRSTGLEKDAEALQTAPSIPHRLAAAALLQSHQGPAAVALLQTLANDPEPAVMALAMQRLLDLEVSKIPEHVKKLAHADPKVRELTLEAYLRQPAREHIAHLSESTKDIHPSVRAKARLALVTYAAKPELRPHVIEAELAVVQTNDWRGLEQACLLFAQLDHKPAAPALVKLLPHARGEVQIASGWAVRRLNVPETLPDVLAFFKKRHQELLGIPGPQRVSPAATARDFQLAQVIQFFGVQRYQPADLPLRPLISQYGGEWSGQGMPPVPPYAVGFEARAAAIWALGMIHDGKTVPAIATQMAGRLAAVNPLDLEDDRVRQMSAVALGMMKAKEQLPTLEQFYADKTVTRNPVNNACGWAIAQINGTPLPPPGTMEVRSRQWFLVPSK